MDESSRAVPLLSSGRENGSASRRTPRLPERAGEGLGDTAPAAQHLAVTPRDNDETQPISIVSGSGDDGVDPAGLTDPGSGNNGVRMAGSKSGGDHCEPTGPGRGSRGNGHPPNASPSSDDASSPDDVAAASADPAPSPDDDPWRGFIPGMWEDPEPPSRLRHPRPARGSQPSWGLVLVTTIRLWTRRRFLRDRPSRRDRLSGRNRPGRFTSGSWRIVVLVIVIIVAVGLAVGLPRDPKKPASGPGRTALGTPAAVRAQAAGWVVQQVSRTAIVSCDPAMCAVLQARGFPLGNLLVITPSSNDPLGSDLIAATSVLRSQFGNRLTSVYAPVVAASFGAGSAGIQMRVIAAQGAAVYLAQLRSDLADRQSNGSQLLHNHGVTVAPSARPQLSAGLVDARLLAAIATVAGFHPLRIVSFGDASPGAAAGTPLRSATLQGGASSPAANAGILSWVRSFLNAQQQPFRPASTSMVRLASGQSALYVQYSAPAPLGVLGAGHPLIKIPSS